MLNILKGVKLAQDDSTGDLYVVDCADGPKKLTGGSGGGGGQFIINVYNTNASGTSFAADKTYDEISAAIESGKEVVIHRKKTINSADYSVFYPCDFLRGSYQFCNSMLRFGETPNINARFISIDMENGEMQIAIFSYNLQTVT